MYVSTKLLALAAIVLLCRYDHKPSSYYTSSLLLSSCYWNRTTRAVYVKRANTTTCSFSLHSNQPTTSSWCILSVSNHSACSIYCCVLCCCITIHSGYGRMNYSTTKRKTPHTSILNIIVVILIAIHGYMVLLSIKVYKKLGVTMINY